jgi:hypothetical protein
MRAEISSWAKRNLFMVILGNVGRCRERLAHFREYPLAVEVGPFYGRFFLHLPSGHVPHLQAHREPSGRTV